MARQITPKDVIKDLEATINFLDINLLEEDLAPSTEMERVETVDRLKLLIEKLNLVNSFIGTTTTPEIKKDHSKTTKSDEVLIPKTTPTKLPITPVPADQMNSPVVDRLVSKLKVLTKCPYGELKQHADHSGILRKYKKQLISKWNKRFCVLRDGILLYFQSETDSKEKGYIILGGYKFVVPPNSNGFVFNLESYDKNTIYTFQADHKKELSGWTEHLLKLTDQGYSESELAAVASIMKDSGGTTVAEDGDYIENSEVSSNSISEPCDYYGDVAPANIVPVGSAIPDEVYGDVEDDIHSPGQTTDDNIYGDVADVPINTVVETPTPITEEIYEDVKDYSGNLHVPPHVPVSNLPPNRLLQPDFSTNNIYIGAYDCSSDGPQELSFNRGDVLYILEKVDLNWWMAFLNGKVGLVPSNFMSEAFAFVS